MAEVKGRQIKYSADEYAWIKRNCVMTRRDLHAAFCKEFSRDDVKLDDIKALCSRRGWLTGRTGRIEKGATPPNKGKKCPPNVGGNSPEACKTQFKKGQTPHTVKYLGHERVDAKDGYVYVSIAETNPHTGFDRRYVLKHKYLWEQKNGPLPAGKCLKCLDGNRTNTDPSNWKMISRATNAILNRAWNGLSYDDAPTELKPSILAIAELKAAASVRAKPTREPRKSGRPGKEAASA
jgi:hypothetical protein